MSKTPQHHTSQAFRLPLQNRSRTVKRLQDLVYISLELSCDLRRQLRRSTINRSLENRHNLNFYFPLNLSRTIYSSQNRSQYSPTVIRSSTSSTSPFSTLMRPLLVQPLVTLYFQALTRATEVNETSGRFYPAKAITSSRKPLSTRRNLELYPRRKPSPRGSLSFRNRIGHS